MTRIHLTEFLSSTNKPLAIFVGAGISKSSPSNIPLSMALKWMILTSIIYGQSPLKQVMRRVVSKGSGRQDFAALPLEHLLTIVYYNCMSRGLDRLLRVFDCPYPNENHHNLAMLILRKIVGTIITTNFDRLLEKELMSHHTGGVEKARIALGFPRGREQVNLMKIHGSVEDPAGMAVTLQRILAAEKTARHITLARWLDDRALVVIGYSGSDRDVWHMLDSCRPSSVLWIVRPYTKLNPWVSSFLATHNGAFLEADLRRVIGDLARHFNVPPYIQPKVEFDASYPIHEFARSLSHNERITTCIDILKSLGRDKKRDFAREVAYLSALGNVS